MAIESGGGVGTDVGPIFPFGFECGPFSVVP